MEQNKEKYRLMLIVPMLHQGGFERICVLTAKLLKDICDVTLVIFSDKDKFYDVSDIHVVNIDVETKPGKIQKIINVLKRINRVRKLKKELHIQLSYSFGTTANLVNVLSKSQDITWAGIRGYGALQEKLKLFCKRADRVVSCTKVMEQDINHLYSVKKSATLYNPCDIEQIQQLSKDEIPNDLADFIRKPGELIISMGREDDLKYFWHLIKSFSLLKKKRNHVKLMIIGDGEYQEYKELAKQLNIHEDVCFTGVRKNPFAILKNADIYALTSESEGFPNALIEAMAVGIPCISVNCKTGPSEILGNDYQKYLEQNKVYYAEYGIITPIFTKEKNLDPDKFTHEEEIFAMEMDKLLSDASLLRKYREAGIKKAAEFSKESYVNHILTLIDEDIV